MKYWNKLAAGILSAALMFSLTACGSPEPEEEMIPKPETLSEQALTADALGIAIELPQEIYDKLNSEVFVMEGLSTYPEGITVNGQMQFVFQSGKVYQRMVEVQSGGTPITDEEYLELVQQIGDLFYITSFETETLPEGDIAAVTGLSNNELLGTLGKNSFYLSYNELLLSGLSEEDQASLDAIKAAIPKIKDGVTLYTPVQRQQGLNLGTVLDEFETRTLTGETVNQSIFQNADLTVINLWATYCTPCVNEMPDLETLAQEYKDKGVQVIGICSDIYAEDEASQQKAKEIVELTGVTYPNLIPDKALEELLLYDITAVPTTIFVNKDGELIGEIVTGTRNLEAFRELTEKYLAEAKK